MFDRFDEDARAAVVYGQEEARLAMHGDIGAEHLLLGILRSTDELASAVLQTSVEQIREQVRGFRPPADRPPAGHIPFTDNAKSAMEHALRVSLGLGQDRITPAHLLVGVLNVGDRVVTLALTGLDVDPAEASNRARSWATTTASKQRRPSPRPRSEQAPGERVADSRTRAPQLIGDLVQQRDALARGLLRYGRHEEACRAPAAVCTCGLDAFLAIASNEDESGLA